MEDEIHAGGKGVWDALGKMMETSEVVLNLGEGLRDGFAAFELPGVEDAADSGGFERE